MGGQNPLLAPPIAASRAEPMAAYRVLPSPRRGHLNGSGRPQPAAGPRPRPEVGAPAPAPDRRRRRRSGGAPAPAQGSQPPSGFRSRLDRQGVDWCKDLRGLDGIQTSLAARPTLSALRISNHQSASGLKLSRNSCLRREPSAVGRISSESTQPSVAEASMTRRHQYLCPSWRHARISQLRPWARRRRGLHALITSEARSRRGWSSTGPSGDRLAVTG